MINWIDGHRIEVVFVLSILVVIMLVVSRLKPSYKNNMALVWAYVFMLTTGIWFIGLTKMEVIPKLSDLSLSNPHNGYNGIRIFMMAFYMMVLLVGYLASARLLVALGVSSLKDWKSANVVLYLWALPLFLLSLIFVKMAGSIPVYIYLLFMIGIIVRNCLLMKRRWYYAIAVAIIGILTGIELCFVFVNIIVQLLLIFLFFFIVYGLVSRNILSLGASSSNFYSAFNNALTEGAYNDAQEGNRNNFDVSIQGGGVFGDDIGANKNADGTLTDEAGRHWSGDAYGNLTRDE